MTDAKPTAQDLANAENRAAIAARFQAEYDQCAAWAEQLFGPGYEPRGRHYLLDKEVEDEARRTGTRPQAAATVFTVRNDAGEKRHFMLRDGQPVEVAGYEEGFGPMLLEPHPTQRIEVRGEKVAPHRYSLCWASIETYRPRSAEALAKTRETRERNKAKREEQKFREENPLLALMEQPPAEEPAAEEPEPRVTAEELLKPVVQRELFD